MQDNLTVEGVAKLPRAEEAESISAFLGIAVFLMPLPRTIVAG